MRVTITQFSDTVPEPEWAALTEHVAAESPELVVLGEMPFARWLPATNQVDPDEWHKAAMRHDAWIARLVDLPDVAVAGSRPVMRNGYPHNEAFLWSHDAGYRPTHVKHYLPDEPGFWEASWYRRSPAKSFRAAPFGDISCGFMICTDMWFTEHARAYAAQGAELLLIPRATELSTGAKWLAGGRVAAVMAGAFCLSSNRQGAAEGLRFGGAGWIIDPEGNVLATTTDQEPFVTLEIDLAEARAAKKSYPRYVAE
jgi:N-carbamoylputrescine amidase